jgi:ribosomal protein S18 acetylase RimI-like enzyme
MLQVRDVESKDMDSIIALDKVTFGQDSFGETGMEYCRAQGMIFRKIGSDKTRILFGFIIISSYDPNELPYQLEVSIPKPTMALAHIMNFCIHPDYRNRGIGSYLLQSSLRSLYDQGYQMVFLETQEKNELARRFYERYKFKVVQRVDHYYRSHQAALVMLSSLNNLPSNSPSPPFDFT